MNQNRTSPPGSAAAPAPAPGAEFSGADSAPAPGAAGVDPKLLEILVCPVTRGPLRYDAAAAELISEQARLAYPIRDGIPIMLPEDARRLDA